MSDSRRRRRPSVEDNTDQPPTRRRRYNTRSAVRERAEEAAGRYWSTVGGHHRPERPHGQSGSARNERPHSAHRSRSNGDTQSRSVEAHGPSTSGTMRRLRSGRFFTDSRRRPGEPNQRRVRTYAAMSTGGQSIFPRLRPDQREDLRSGRSTENRDRSSRPTTSGRPSSSSEAVRQARSLVGLFRVSSPARRHRFAAPSNPRPSRGSNIISGSRSRADGFNPTVAIEDIFGIPSSSIGSSRATSARTRVASTRSNNHIAYVSPIVRPTHITTSGSRFNIRVAFGTDDEDSESNDSLLALDRGLSNLLSGPEGESSSDDVFYSDLERLESDSGDSIESASTAEPPQSHVSLSLNALHPSPTPSLSSAETEIHDDDDDEEEEDDDAFRIIHIPDLYSDAVSSQVIFMRNSVISVDLMRRMAELSDAVSNLRNRLQTQTDGGFTPPRNYNLEPTRRRVPESVDCQRAKLTDELNSGTCECVICTDAIRNSDQVWPCNNCFNIFHLPCIRRWAKTNRATEMDGAWICPVCRRPKFCTPNKLRYRCLCGRVMKPKSVPGVTPHCCGKQCKHNCGLLCHPGPCKMSEAESAAVARASCSNQGPHLGHQAHQAAEEPTRAASV